MIQAIDIYTYVAAAKLAQPKPPIQPPPSNFGPAYHVTIGGK